MKWKWKIYYILCEKQDFTLHQWWVSVVSDIFGSVNKPIFIFYWSSFMNMLYQVFEKIEEGKKGVRDV